MGSDNGTTPATFEPQVCSDNSRLILERFARRIRRAASTADSGAVDDAVRNALKAAIAKRRDWPEDDRRIVEAGLRVLADLALQRWRLSVGRKGIQLRPPEELVEGSVAERDRIRRQELLKRDEQLATSSVRKFVTDMERRRIFGETFVSIFSLFRDGRELAEQLRRTRQLAEDEQFASLTTVIDPYLVFVDEDNCCPFTGLRLMDIWRYFRHTWASQYTSVPGRSMMFLVRDRAAAMHPVLGIGAISSPIVQIQQRDTWIGWHPQTVLEQLRASPSGNVGTWLRRVVSHAMEELYIQDFLEENDDGRLLSVAQLRSPTQELIETLRTHAEHRRSRHWQFSDQAEHKAKPATDSESRWKEQARTHLFASKRALALAGLLEAQITLDRFLSKRPTKKEVAALVDDRDGRRVILRLVRKAKADRIGIAMADITVCGAVPPYGPLLGGKLVSMLAASPEIVSAYRDRYRGTESEIASSMAGRPIRRPADLVFLGTSSLYGRSSQYNRVRVPVERLGGAPGTDLSFIRLGESETFGTSHYSEETLRALDDVLHHSPQGRRVNYIFGEGTSPKLRKVREGLTQVGFPEALLRHHRRRVIYGVPLVSNLREYLLGMDAKPTYLFETDGPDATKVIADWWRERWLLMRIKSDSFVSAVEQQTLTWPIRHGARVELPPENSGQSELYEDM